MAARLRRELSGAVELALWQAERWMSADPSGNIHAVYYGRRLIAGQPHGSGIVFGVQEKSRQAALGSGLVPRRMSGAPTDVQEIPPLEAMLLRVSAREALALNAGVPICAVRSDDLNAIHQRCHDAPLPGGVEIRPTGRNWLGTLGCKVVYRAGDGKLRHGAVTNWHVATGKPGQQMVQPANNANWFAQVAFSPGLDFSGNNYIDIAVLDIERSDGLYAPRTHTVKPEQVSLGKYQPQLSSGGVGSTVARDGRTLGRLTDGKCVGIGATVRVSYGADGTAVFNDQMVFSRAAGEFSAPGDSGSLIFEYPAMRPFALLFAGGGGTTIGSPLEYALELARVHSFQ